MRKQRGATLLETLLATAIAGVLTSAAAPAFGGLLSKQRLGSVGHDLLASFSLARSEAIRRGGAVAVAPARSGDWSSGWKVYADVNDNGRLDAGEMVIAERQLAFRGLSIAPRFGALHAGDALAYGSDGRLHRSGSHGMVLGRLVMSYGGEVRSVCFASLGLRITAAARCE